MQLESFYGQILGVKSPWKVVSVTLDTELQLVDVFVDFMGVPHCPCCDERATIHDYAKERVWRHLDSCQMKTYLHCRLPRTKCSKCKVKTLIPSWSKPKSRFTLMFEAFIIEVLLATKCDTETAKILRMTAKEVLTVKDRAVDRGLDRRELNGPKALAIDEKSFGKGHNYLTILVDHENSKVIEVCKDRTEVAIRPLLETYCESERENVEAITMDMWRPFWSVSEELYTNAKLIHDRYHVASHMSTALEQTRRAEQKTLETDQGKALKGMRFTLLRSEDNRSKKDFIRLAELEKRNLKTTTVFLMKEVLREIFEAKSTVEEAKTEIEAWVLLAKEQKISNLTRVANMIQSHIGGICNYFDKRLTNSVAETVNSFIQELKSRARGFKNWARYRINILFHLGKLDMDPLKRS